MRARSSHNETTSNPSLLPPKKNPPWAIKTKGRNSSDCSLGMYTSATSSSDKSIELMFSP